MSTLSKLQFPRITRTQKWPGWNARTNANAYEDFSTFIRVDRKKPSNKHLSVGTRSTRETLKISVSERVMFEPSTGLILGNTRSDNQRGRDIPCSVLCRKYSLGVGLFLLALDLILRPLICWSTEDIYEWSETYDRH